MATITSTPVRVFTTMSGSVVTIVLADGLWHVTYVGGHGTSVFTCEDWCRDVYGRVVFFGFTPISGRPIVHTSPATLVATEGGTVN